MSRWRRWLVLSLAGLTFGCGEDNPLGPDGSVVIEPITIESVDVSVGPERPARVIAQVKGVLGGGCDFLHSIEQRRRAPR